MTGRKDAMETVGGYMGYVHIPETLEGARTELEGLGALLTAKQWERAAIVYAFTRDGGQGPAAKTANRGYLTTGEFARLNIRGLENPDTVRAYRKAWKVAIASGQASECAPGDTIPIPETPWKEVFGEPTTEVQQRVFRSVVRDPEQFRAALHDDPSTVIQLAERVKNTPAVRAAVEHRLADPIQPREVEVIQPRARDLGDDLQTGVNLLVPVLRAIQRGTWTPNTAQTMLLAALGTLISQAAAADTEPVDDLFTDIERYLREAVS